MTVETPQTNTGPAVPAHLAFVAEEGEISARGVDGEVAGDAWRTVRDTSKVAGLRGATDLPTTPPRDARIRFRFLRDRVQLPKGKPPRRIVFPAGGYDG